MQNEKFIIRAYGKSELAMLYLPRHTKETAMKLFRSWLVFNPQLRHIVSKKNKYYTPKQVENIVKELGEPFDLE